MARANWGRAVMLGVSVATFLAPTLAVLALAFSAVLQSKNAANPLLYAPIVLIEVSPYLCILSLVVILFGLLMREPVTVLFASLGLIANAFVLWMRVFSVQAS